MNLSDHIADLITAGTELRKDPGTDKEWLNRTLSHLKSAYACSNLLSGNVSSLNQKPSTANFTGISRPITSSVGQCICPSPTVRDANCRAHA